ncbi:U4/U6 x U5 tri-snRNP complex subunit Prp1 [Coemansia erecta]|uniref:U4/U6 x U5 tri-snRNP complex subunit Prp1 n=1 Tax=Coemansia erecta TaxID=147472 RepID=A0A9W8CPY7_9FUNG|nr:U4/U6 x U5 tri-snRNP complex subunit Prp1 [Coemansia erecta]
MYAVTKDFLGKPAPPGYVAGLGRGATGFTTRSDIGPAREASTRKTGDNNNDNDRDDDDRRFADAENEEGLLSNLAPGDADDEEADQVWSQIDQHMAQRRRQKSKRTVETADAQDIDENDNGVTRDMQALKRQLQTVSAEEWAAIPDVAQVAETSARAKRRRRAAGSTRHGERLAQGSDASLLATFGLEPSRSAEAAVKASVDGAAGEQQTDFVALGQARDDVLRLTLDRLAQGSNGSGGSGGAADSVDREGYLTSLAQPGRAAEIADVGRARELLRSVTLANPRHAAAWIARARVEELAATAGTAGSAGESQGSQQQQQMSRARAVIAQACERCARSEDVWLEAARLAASPNDARAVLAQAARHVPRSVRLWTAAADLEQQAGQQKRVLRRALEHVPQSSALWKRLVALEDDPAEARVLLAHAVDLAPAASDLWLALARLETHEKARRVLNRARRALPQSTDVWVAAVRLEEQHAAGDDRLLAIAQKAVGALARVMSRALWLDEAARCADDGFPRTCVALVRAAPAEDADAEAEAEAEAGGEEAARALVADAQRMAPRSAAVARALFDGALAQQPQSESAWRAAADFERMQPDGGRQQLAALLQRAVVACPQAEVLWLMAAKHAWTGLGDVEGARGLLERAFAAHPASEHVLLAAVKLESHAGELPRALALLARARTMVFGQQQQRRPGGPGGPGGTPRVWMKSAVLLRQTGRVAEARDVCAEALELFPGGEEPRLYLVLAQSQQTLGDAAGARQTYARGLRACRQSTALWLAAAALEEELGSATRARAVLERARVAMPKDALVWRAAVRLEARVAMAASQSASSSAASTGASLAEARALLARALQACPRAGCLWAESVVLAERAQRKARSVDALKNADANDACVIVAVARLFWAEAKADKARAWLLRACSADPDYGDAWAWRLAFEQAHMEAEPGAEARVAEIEKACAEADPRHGDAWPAVAKHPDNAGRATVDILRMVAGRLARSRNPL